MKYHACLFAFLRGVPLIIVPYHPKCQSLGHEIGVGSDAILTMEDLLAGLAVSRLESLVSSPLAYNASLGVTKAGERATSGIAAFLQSLER